MKVLQNLINKPKNQFNELVYCEECGLEFKHEWATDKNVMVNICSGCGNVQVIEIEPDQTNNIWTNERKK